MADAKVKPAKPPKVTKKYKVVGKYAGHNIGDIVDLTDRAYQFAKDRFEPVGHAPAAPPPTTPPPPPKV